MKDLRGQALRDASLNAEQQKAIEENYQAAVAQVQDEAAAEAKRREDARNERLIRGLKETADHRDFEALRLGCEAFASDLNPVACLILKVMLEDIPRHGPKLAEDLRRVGKEIKEHAEKELAEFYPEDPDGADSNCLSLGADCTV